MPYLVENIPPTERELLSYRLEGGKNSPVEREAGLFLQGFRIEDDEDRFLLPDRIIVTPRSDGFIPDFGQHRWTWIVSDRFVDIVERLEPSLHQFIPFKECIDNKGKQLSRQFYFMNCLIRLHAIDEKKSSVVVEENFTKTKKIPTRFFRWKGPSTSSNYKCFVLNGCENGYHLWGGNTQTGKRFSKVNTQFAECRFFSDELYEAVQKAELSPQKYFKSSTSCNKKEDM